MQEIKTKEQQRRTEILTGSLYKLIVKLSLPIMLSNLIQTVYSLTDMYFVSTIGDDQVAAVGFVWPMIFLYMALGLGVALGARAIISQRIGEGDEAGAIEAAGQTLSFMFIISFGLSMAGIIAVPWILKLMGGTGAIYSEGLSYSRIIISGMPLMYVFFAYQTIKQAEGDMVTPMLVLVGSVVLNMILDPIFIMVLGWGVNGAALATTLSRLAAALVLAGLILANKKSNIYKSLSHLKPRKETILEILKIGMPSGIGRVTAALGFMVMNGFIISYGNHVMTAFSIGNRIISLVMMPSMGIGSATTTIIGQNMGAGQIDRVKQALKKTLIIALGFSLLGMMLTYAFKEGIFRIFTDTVIVIESGSNFTDIMVLTLPLMAVFQVMAGFFIGTKHSLAAMMGDIVRLWALRIPMIIFFKFALHMDEYAIWLPMLISNVLTDMMFLAVYLSKRWQKPVKR